jgi:hypothetical protein
MMGYSIPSMPHSLVRKIRFAIRLLLFHLPLSMPLFIMNNATTVKMEMLKISSSELPRSKLRGIQFSKKLSSPLMGEDQGRGDDKIISPPPLPTGRQASPLPPGERGGHSSPQQSWEVF